MSSVKQDHLSDLPDSLLLRILSFLEAKYAVQTCILSKRYTQLWKNLPTLSLDCYYYTNLRAFTKFVSRLLSLRQPSTSLQALHFRRTGIVEPRILKRIVNYAVSHNVQCLQIRVICDIQHFPTCLFSCKTLTSLNLSVLHPNRFEQTFFPSSLDLPALTGLSLKYFVFRVGNNGHAEPFSAFKNLNSLIINNCAVLDEQNLCISSATLANLTLQTRQNQYGKIKLSTPSLATFVFFGIGDVPVSKQCRSKTILSSVKHADIDVIMCSDYANHCPSVLLNLLVQLSDIKSLTISSRALEVLSFVPDLLKVEFPALCNLKLLKVKVLNSSTIAPDGIMDFLLQNTPSAKVDIIHGLRMLMG